MDVLFLTTSNKDVEKVLSADVLDRWPSFAKAKIVLVSHNATNFDIFDDPSSTGWEWGRSVAAQEALAQAWQDDRLTYLVLSSAVQAATKEALARNPYLSPDLSRPPKAKVFVPVSC